MSLCASSGVAKASFGSEFETCFLISRVVFSGLAVVMTAPSDMTDRQTMGKEREFGESIRMTWPLRIFHVEEREWESESTDDQRSE